MCVRKKARSSRYDLLGIMASKKSNVVLERYRVQHTSTTMGVVFSIVETGLRIGALGIHARITLCFGRLGVCSRWSPTRGIFP